MTKKEIDLKKKGHQRKNHCTPVICLSTEREKAITVHTQGGGGRGRGSGVGNGLSGALPFPEPQSLWKTAPWICLPPGHVLGAGNRLMSEVTSRPYPHLPGPKSRTRYGWLVQGTVCDYGMRPRFTLQVSDLAEARVWLLAGEPEQVLEAQKDWAVRSGRVSTQPSATALVVWSPRWKKKNVLHRRLSLCNFTVSVLFSISEQVKWRKDTGDLFKYKD